MFVPRESNFRGNGVVAVKLRVHHICRTGFPNNVLIIVLLNSKFVYQTEHVVFFSIISLFESGFLYVEYILRIYKK